MENVLRGGGRAAPMGLQAIHVVQHPGGKAVASTSNIAESQPRR